MSRLTTGLPVEPARDLSAGEAPDVPPPTLERILGDCDIADVVCQIASPSSVAMLGACSRGLCKSFFHAPEPWRALLARHFRVPHRSAAQLSHVRREFARRTICARLARRRQGLQQATAATAAAADALPPAGESGHSSPRSPALAWAAAGRTDGGLVAMTPAPPAWAAGLAAVAGSGGLSRSWSSAASAASTKENVAPQPRRPLRDLDGRRGLLDFGGESGANIVANESARGGLPARGGASAPASRCRARELDVTSIARLREGLRQLILSGDAAMTACPEEAGEWAVWSARIGCPHGDGSPAAGLLFRLRLHYVGASDAPADVGSGAPRAGSASRTSGRAPTAAEQASHDGAIGADDLPRVVVLSPSPYFHPNVHPTTGTLDPIALCRRCAAVDLVGDHLRSVLELLRTPCFAVPPLNAEAAARWYGDAVWLRSRIRQAPHEALPEPSSAPALARADSSPS